LDPISALQRTYGNRATQMFIQRFWDRFTQRDIHPSRLSEQSLNAYLGDPSGANSPQIRFHPALSEAEVQELLGEWQQRQNAARRSQQTEPGQMQNNARWANQDKLNRLFNRKSVLLSAPVRRHRIREVTADDVKGHNQFTTVSGDDLDAYTKAINRGEFSDCWLDRGAARISVGDRIFGCTVHREGGDLILYPVDGPTCTSLSLKQLEAMVHIRSGLAVTEYVRKWYATEIDMAVMALARAQIFVTSGRL
jgi:hypothetical protein